MSERQNPTSPTPSSFDSSWLQYQQLRLARLRQQRQRMSSMKDIVEKYARTIAELEDKNHQLLAQSEEYRLGYQRLYLENKQLRYEKQQLLMELQRETQIRDDLQDTVRRLKEDISVISAGLAKGRTNQPDGYNYQVEYETLQELYEGIKKQYYTLSKDNAQLKQIIQQQSLQFSAAARQRGTPSGHIKTKTEQTQPSRQKQRQKISQLQQQIAKQKQLIQKFKQTEEQQQELITLLKNQKTKICICHEYGRSSKKIITGKKIEEKEPAVDNLNSNISIKLT